MDTCFKPHSVTLKWLRFILHRFSLPSQPLGLLHCLSSACPTLMLCVAGCGGVVLGFIHSLRSNGSGMWDCAIHDREVDCTPRGLHCNALQSSVDLSWTKTGRALRNGAPGRTRTCAPGLEVPRKEATGGSAKPLPLILLPFCQARDDDAGPHIGCGPSSHEKSESDPRDRDEERWPDRARGHDPRDVF